jgi:hypothetical protein
MRGNHRQVHGQDATQSGTGIEILPSRRSGGLIRAQSPAILQEILPRPPPVFQDQRFLGRRFLMTLIRLIQFIQIQVKNTLKKAIRIVSGGSDTPTNKGSTFSVASQLTGSGVMSASVLLPGDPSRRSSMPVLPTHSGGGASGFVAELFDRHRSHHQGRSSHHSNFVVPRIQVSYWSNTVGGNIPPPPSGTPKVIPAEMRPSHSRQRSRSSIRS